jgi:hypothetical protein
MPLTVEGEPVRCLDAAGVLAAMTTPLPPGRQDPPLEASAEPVSELPTPDWVELTESEALLPELPLEEPSDADVLLVAWAVLPPVVAPTAITPALTAAAAASDNGTTRLRRGRRGRWSGSGGTGVEVMAVSLRRRRRVAP